jgi:hypothetical protein
VFLKVIFIWVEVTFIFSKHCLLMLSTASVTV